jgi:hypothetical protein
VTGSTGDFIPAYSRTLEIILRSMGVIVRPVILLIHLIMGRILLASIRNLGSCPCPRCLIPLSRAHNVGMVTDMAQRTRLARIDDNHRKIRVTTARRLIYDKQHRVNSAAVENLLKEESLVPTSVCAYDLLTYPHLDNSASRMHSQRDYHHSASTSLSCLLSI